MCAAKLKERGLKQKRLYPFVYREAEKRARAGEKKLEAVARDQVESCKPSLFLSMCLFSFLQVCACVYERERENREK